MPGVLLLVLGFQTSSDLAAAYGIAVTGAMEHRAVLAGMVAATRWRWGVPLAVAGVRLAFCCSTSPTSPPTRSRSPQGGWFPLLVAGLLRLHRVTWRRGRGSAAPSSSTAMGPSLRNFIDKLTPS